MDKTSTMRNYDSNETPIFHYCGKTMTEEDIAKAQKEFLEKHTFAVFFENCKKEPNKIHDMVFYYRNNPEMQTRDDFLNFLEEQYLVVMPLVPKNVRILFDDGYRKTELKDLPRYEEEYKKLEERFRRVDFFDVGSVIEKKQKR